LDEELASGRISADDYRVRRDTVLSSAVNADTQSPPSAPTQADSTQIIAPLGQPQQPAPESGAAADRTQVVNHGDASGAERTQVTRPGWQGPAAWPAGHGEAERTQVVPGVPPQAFAGGFGQPPGSGPNSGGFPAQQPLWNAPSPDTSTPWGGGDFPPLAAPPSNDWAGQGPEVFETSSSGGKKKTIGIIVALVVVVALGVGAFFFFSSNSSTTAQSPTPSSSQASAPPVPPKDDLEIAKLPGAVAEVANFTNFADVVARKVLTTDESDAYSAAGANTARMAVSTLPSGTNLVTLTVETTSPSDASNAVDQLEQLQLKFGMHAYAGSAPDGVQVVQLDKAAGGLALIRAHYVHKNTVVRVQVDGTDLAEVGRVFDEVLAAQTQALPVGN
jgi:hypothetical protein